MKLVGSTLLLLGALAAPAASQSEGRYLVDPDLDGLSQTGADKYAEFVGRTVLIEFFAYW